MPFPVHEHGATTDATEVRQFGIWRRLNGVITDHQGHALGIRRVYEARNKSIASKYRIHVRRPKMLREADKGGELARNCGRGRPPFRLKELPAQHLRIEMVGHFYRAHIKCLVVSKLLPALKRERASVATNDPSQVAPAHRSDDVAGREKDTRFAGVH